MSLSRGFTLVEMVIVVALLAVVGAFSIPFLYSSSSANDVQVEAVGIVTTLRRAQQQAVSGQNQADWGVGFEPSQQRFILFQGNTFAGRDQSLDLAITYPAAIALSTDFGDEIFFTVYSGQPSAGGTISLATGDTTKLILINSDGKIELGN